MFRIRNYMNQHTFSCCIYFRILHAKFSALLHIFLESKTFSLSAFPLKRGISFLHPLLGAPLSLHHLFTSLTSHEFSHMCKEEHVEMCRKRVAKEWSISRFLFSVLPFPFLPFDPHPLLLFSPSAVNEPNTHLIIRIILISSLTSPTSSFIFSSVFLVCALCSHLNK